ncbi:MFS transporter [Enterococcus sp. BWB1-3]|uniref:MFS transporter n=1 Tax=Enterococcus sp. BWB1-3 TaxID=2787713 RepID=UPI00192286F3|nr:MFS transporter [Enterococcus sp. BWB1-3]MBL1230061.1 MFS transporter [Enterococcus sp. BWB1-3]
MSKISKSAVILLMGTLFSRIAMFMSIPFLAIYLSDVAMLTPTQIGYIIGINPFVNVLFSLVAGKLIDLIQVKKILVLIPVIWGVIFILFSFADRFVVFMILNGMNGLCYTIYEPSCKKSLSMYTRIESKLLIFNLRYAAINIGAIVGPMLSITLGFKYTIKPYIILGIIYIIVGLTNLFLSEDEIPKIKKDTDKHTKESKKAIFLDKNFKQLILLIIGVMFSYFGYSQFNSTISQYLSQESSSGVELYSSLLSFSALAILLFQFPVIRWTKKFRSNYILAISNLLFSSCLFIVIFFPSYFSLLLFTILYSLGELLLGARFDYAIDQIADEENKGAYFSWSELIKIGSTMGPIVGGILISNLNWNHHIQIFSILGAITMIGSFFIFYSKISN